MGAARAFSNQPQPGSSQGSSCSGTLWARLTVPGQKYRHLGAASYGAELTLLTSDTKSQNRLEKTKKIRARQEGNFHVPQPTSRRSSGRERPPLTFTKPAQHPRPARHPRANTGVAAGSARSGGSPEAERTSWSSRACAGVTPPQSPSTRGEGRGCASPVWEKAAALTQPFDCLPIATCRSLPGHQKPREMETSAHLAATGHPQHLKCCLRAGIRCLPGHLHPITMI